MFGSNNINNIRKSVDAAAIGISRNGPVAGERWMRGLVDLYVYQLSGSERVAYGSPMPARDCE